MDGLRPYPDYKDSGLHWLGRIPKHWNEKRAKYFFREVDERSTTGEEQLMSVSHKTGVTPRKSNVTMFKAATNVGHKICRSGDLAINTLWAWMAALGVSRQTGLVSPAYGVYRQRDVANYHPDFIEFLLRTPAYASEYRCRSTGITSSRLRLYPIDFLRIPLVQPPRDEQDLIVSYLRQQDAMVRKFIQNRRMLIEVLSEQKQAIINQAVMRGLDPTVPRKLSGFEWLGDIPTHWSTVPLKHSCVFVRDGTHLPPSRTSTGIPLLSVRNIVNGRFVRRKDDSFISQTDYNILCRSFVPQPGDVLLAIVGATLGKVAIIPEMEPFHVQRSLAVLRPNRRMLGSEFLSLFLQSQHFQGLLWQTVAFSAQPGIYLGTIAAMPTTLPPVVEQRQIVGEVQSRLMPICTAVSQAEHEVSLMREYRERLIVDIVTGKLDVRHLAAPLDSLDTDGGFETDLPEDDDAGMIEEIANADD